MDCFPNAECNDENGSETGLTLPLTPLQMYLASGSIVQLSVPGWFAMTDCNDFGDCGKQSFVVVRLNGPEGHPVCSCRSGTEKCLHLEAVVLFRHDEQLQHETVDHTYSSCPTHTAVDQLASRVFATFDGKTYGVVRRLRSRLSCSTCSTAFPIQCGHVAAMQAWLDVNQDDELPECDETQKHTAPPCLSTCSFDYPPVKEIVDQYRKQCEDGIPEVMKPTVEPEAACTHGHRWSEDDPVSRGWIRSRNGRIFYMNWTDTTSRIGKMRVVIRKMHALIIVFGYVQWLSGRQRAIAIAS